MSWLNLNQSLNSIKGQITNFASEVLSEGVGQEPGDDNHGASSSYSDLEAKCRNQELEISALKKLNDELQATLQPERLSKKNGNKEGDNTWYWDPSPEFYKQQQGDDGGQNKQQKSDLQEEVPSLKDRVAFDINENANEELIRLRKENKNLTNNLEDLDTQHQLAMDRLLSLKKDLQMNFELLKQEHEVLKQSNDEYSTEIKTVLKKLGERDKEIEELKTARADYDTLHSKYQNLEKIYGLLRENAEKFQEENQALHEEVFNLQEQLTKMEHDLEIASKHSEISDVVPRERYDDILKELNDIKHRRNSSRIHSDELNIDDNAKSVIENLKLEIHDLKHKVSLKECSNHDSSEKGIPAEKIMQLYIKYVNFEIPVDLVGEMPASGDNIVMFKLESVFKTLNSFKKEIEAYEHRVLEKNSSIRSLQSQVDDLTSENDYLTTDLQHFESELKEMKKNNDFLINELASLKNTSKLPPIIETHEDNLVKLESELADSNKLNKTFEAEIHRIEDELNKAKREKSFLSESLEEIKSKFQLMLSDLEECKKQTIAIEEMESTANNNHADKLKISSKEIENLKKKLNAAIAKNEQLTIDVHIIENDKVLLTKVVDDLKHELADKITSHSDLETLKTTLALQLKDIESKIDDIIDKKTDVKKQDLKLKDKIKWLAEEISSNISRKEAGDHEQHLEINEKLKISLNDNSTMLETIQKLKDELVTLKEMQQQQQLERDSLKNKSNLELQEITLLQQTILDLEEKVSHAEKVKNELHTLKEENKILIQTKLEVEAQLASTDLKMVQFEEEFEKLFSDLNEKDNIIDSLNTTVSHNQINIIDLKQNITDLSNSVTVKQQEIERLTKVLTDITEKFNSTVETLNRSQSELHRLQNNKEELELHCNSLIDEITFKNLQLSTLTNRLEEVEKNYTNCKKSLSEKDKRTKELTQSVVEITDKITHQNDERAKFVQEMETKENEVVELKHTVSVRDKEILDLNTKSDQTEKACQECKTVLDRSNAEKNELINLVNLKHNESIQYHKEIQRLNNVLVEQSNEFKKVIDGGKINSDNCTNCNRLRATLKEKDEIIMSLNTKVIDYEKERVGLLNTSDILNSLKERCDNLEKSYATQLEIVKRLTAENAQLSVKEQNSTRELERLRQHLVETEENYTRELMTAEQKLSECQTRLQNVEQRAKQTSTVYTSNSIRANQEVETLRNQIKLLEKQREDVQSRLSDAEDGMKRRDAALTNLQIVLEQFQIEKERDILSATEKIRNRTEELKRDNDRLQDEIARLNVKLKESMAGLQAATRLGDQVETKLAQINDLKQQVHTLQTTVAASEERYHNAITNQQDKVDKNLVKNLVINYVASPPYNNNKTQVLKILSTVLDFNQRECEKLGLVRSPPSQDSLAAEFVKFLQNESLPRPRLPSVPTASTNSSPRSSVAPSPVESSHQRSISSGSSNLLFQHIDPVEAAHNINMEMNTGVNQTRNNEGAILKRVLNDNSM